MNTLVTSFFSPRPILVATSFVDRFLKQESPTSLVVLLY